MTRQQLREKPGVNGSAVAKHENGFTFASGGQGDSFRENRPVKHLDPPQKLFISGDLFCPCQSCESPGQKFLFAFFYRMLVKKP